MRKSENSCSAHIRHETLRTQPYTTLWRGPCYSQVTMVPMATPAHFGRICSYRVPTVVGQDARAWVSRYMRKPIRFRHAKKEIQITQKTDPPPPIKSQESQNSVGLSESGQKKNTLSQVLHKGNKVNYGRSVFGYRFTLKKIIGMGNSIIHEPGWKFPTVPPAWNEQEA